MRMIDDILEPFNNSFMVVYLDGILKFNQILEEHLHHIQWVLQIVWDQNLCTNLEKCTFRMT